MSNLICRPEDYGTEWVPFGEGDDLATVLRAFGEQVKAGDETRTTELRLNGKPITSHDRGRLAASRIGQLGSYVSRPERVGRAATR